MCLIHIHLHIHIPPVDSKRLSLVHDPIPEVSSQMYR